MQGHERCSPRCFRPGSWIISMRFQSNGVSTRRAIPLIDWDGFAVRSLAHSASWSWCSMKSCPDTWRR
ncbi:hypothetical protein PMAYCL1PPCAC_16404 [Pristionchus mayeri]|uniref:Uncharacterized protein n=1 Tax=Pristionchus mayeri TaxID=1317129 RepID=A0AAN5CKT2_9BILA|nr:hypothetical protein PMAYCL1PPCAC_16404 [Pristionchus mayeri]